MRLGPWLVVRGTILGSVVVVLVGLLITSSATFPPPARAEATPPAETPAPQAAAESEPEAGSPLEDLPAACEVSQNYPQKILRWCDLITRYAGAVGLMQVMPRDGLAASFMCVNGPCFANRPTISELEDPEFNVKYGTRMLAGLLNKYSNFRDALKAYGPKDVGYYYADIVLGHYQRYGE